MKKTITELQEELDRERTWNAQRLEDIKHMALNELNWDVARNGITAGQAVSLLVASHREMKAQNMRLQQENGMLEVVAPAPEKESFGF